MMPPAPEHSSDLTAKQKAVLNHLGMHPWTRQDDLARAVGSTVRGVGVVLSALTWRDDVHLRHRDGWVANPDRPGGADAIEWSVG